MVGRREFLQIAPATITGGMLGPWSRAFGSVAPLGEAIFDAAVVDASLAESRAFREVLVARGVRIAELGGDVASLWYDALRPRLRRERVPFAGLTDRSVLFCLEELARDVGMRVVARIDHLIERDGRVRHSPIVPDAFDGSLPAIGYGARFGNLSAASLMQHAWHLVPGGPAQKQSGPAAPADITALVTWVIA